jgi:hypothetical protein
VWNLRSGEVLAELAGAQRLLDRVVSDLELSVADMAHRPALPGGAGRMAGVVTDRAAEYGQNVGTPRGDGRALLARRGRARRVQRARENSTWNIYAAEQ